MFKGKKENYPFSVCRPFLDTRIGKKVIFLLLCVQESTLIPTVFFLIHEGVEDINIKVLQMIQREHIKVNCSFLLHSVLLSPYILFLHHSTASQW